MSSLAIYTFSTINGIVCGTSVCVCVGVCVHVTWVGGWVYYAGEKEWASMLNNIQGISSLRSLIPFTPARKIRLKHQLLHLTILLYSSDLPRVQGCMVIHLLYTVEKITIGHVAAQHSQLNYIMSCHQQRAHAHVQI